MLFEQSNLGEQVKSQKEIEWEAKQLQADKIVDVLGLEIDSGIKDCVVAFMANDFSTSGSCEGHLAEQGTDQRGHCYPWIDICVPEPEGWQESQEKKDQWTIENLKQQQKMIQILEDFYKNRQTPFDARLVFTYIGIFGAFRVQSFGAKTMDLLSFEEKTQKLELYRKEMSDFAEFLKQKFLQK